jgi:release factor glutamine methyltransferase
VAIAVARERPGARLHATDLSAGALEVARLNAAEQGVGDRIVFHRGDLFEPLRQARLEACFDAILSNPPYIGSADLPGLEPEVRDHEPRIALTPGDDPLLVHRRLAQEAPAFLKRGGHLIVEFGAGQEEALRVLYGGQPALAILEVRRDLAGLPRILVVGSA